MDKRELAYAKQSVLATPNWDIFQTVIRKVLKPIPIFSTSKATGCRAV
jgi:hypothetical protein